MSSEQTRSPSLQMVDLFPDCLLRIAGLLDFVHRPEFQIPQNTTFRKLDLFPSSGEGKETPTLLDPLERANLSHWTQPKE
jgi:hypothetical protein